MAFSSLKCLAERGVGKRKPGWLARFLLAHGGCGYIAPGADDARSMAGQAGQIEEEGGPTNSQRRPCASGMPRVGRRSANGRRPVNPFIIKSVASVRIGQQQAFWTPGGLVESKLLRILYTSVCDHPNSSCLKPS